MCVCEDLQRNLLNDYFKHSTPSVLRHDHHTAFGLIRNGNGEDGQAQPPSFFFCFLVSVPAPKYLIATAISFYLSFNYNRRPGLNNYVTDTYSENESKEVETDVKIVFEKKKKIHLLEADEQDNGRKKRLRDIVLQLRLPDKRSSVQ